MHSAGKAGNNGKQKKIDKQQNPADEKPAGFRFKMR